MSGVTPKPEDRQCPATTEPCLHHDTGAHVSSDSKAVFLSYATQDAAAARRICDALRAAGVQVWFDQSELRGGDQRARGEVGDVALQSRRCLKPRCNSPKILECRGSP